MQGRHRTIRLSPTLRRGLISLIIHAQEAFLRHFRLEVQNFAQHPIANDPSQFPHHGIPGIIVNHSKEPFVFSTNLPNSPSLLARHRKCLFTNHRHSPPQTLQDHFTMIGRGRENGNGIQVVAFMIQKLREVTETPFPSHTINFGRFCIHIRLPAECPGLQIPEPVHSGGNKVGIAHGRIWRAAHEGKAKGSRVRHKKI